MVPPVEFIPGSAIIIPVFIQMDMGTIDSAPVIWVSIPIPVKRPDSLNLGL
jgi:hypothetical protein